MVRWNYERDACEFHISRAIVDFQKINVFVLGQNFMFLSWESVDWVIEAFNSVTATAC